MGNRDCDVTTTRVPVVGDSDTKTLKVGTASFDQKTRPLFPSACERSDGIHVTFAGGDDVAYWAPPPTYSKFTLGETTGTRCTLVTPYGRYWVDRLGGGTHYWEWLWDGARNRLPIPIGRTSQGIAYQEPNGLLRWSDEFVKHPVYLPPGHPNAIRFHDPYVSGAWTFGLRANNRVIAYNASTGLVYDCGLDGNFGPRGRECLDGSGIVAVNRYGKFQESSKFTIIPLIGDELPTRFHATFMDAYRHGTPPRRSWLGGTVSWGAPAADQRPGYGDVDEVDALTSAYAMVIGTEDASETYIARSIAKAVHKDYGVVVYSDKPTYTPEALEILSRVRQAGCRGYRGIQAYAYSSESIDEASDRIQREVRDADHAGDRVVLISRADWLSSVALAPRLHTMINETFRTTIIGHGVFGCERPGAIQNTITYWLDKWATMPRGVILPL